MSLEKSKKVQLDRDGYLCNFLEWSPVVAKELAADCGIVLTDEHWDIIKAVRSFYSKYHISPTQRPFVKYIAETLGKDKGNSLYLLKMFTSSSALIAAKISGLPRPVNCF